MLDSKLVTEKDKEVIKVVTSIHEELLASAVGKSTFKPLDYYRDRLLQLTGAFGYLNSRWAEFRVLRDNGEIKGYVEAKRSAEASGEKFSVASGEKEARAVVQEFYELEKVFESFKDASEQGILTLKKVMDVEMLELERENKS